VELELTLEALLWIVALNDSMFDRLGQMVNRAMAEAGEAEKERPVKESGDSEFETLGAGRSGGMGG